jgi:hypothetical protein
MHIKYVPAVPQQYVNFYPDGTIFSVGPGKNENMLSLAVDYNSVLGLLSLKENTEDYRVEFNTVKKEYELKKLYGETVAVNGLVKIEENLEHWDLKLIFNKNTVTLKMHSHLKSHLEQSGYNFNKKFLFSITEKNNPFAFLKGLKISINESIKIDDLESFSVYTEKEFDVYSFEVLDD